MGDLAHTAAVAHSLTAATLLELQLAGRLVEAVELAGGVGTSDELPGQLHVFPVIQIQGKLWHAQAFLEARFDKEVDEGTLARCPSYLQACVYTAPRAQKEFQLR